MKRKTKSLLSILFWISLIFLCGFLMYVFSSCSDNYEKPESINTPPLASLPRDQWPEHGLNAVKRGLAWGQCGECGFPVTTEDVRNGFGSSVGVFNQVYYETFLCYRHVDRVL